MIGQLIEVISQKVSLTDHDIQLCRQYFEEITVERNIVLERQDQIPRHLYFIASGFIRLYYVDSKGEDKTTLLATDNSFVTPYLSFINKSVAAETLESITKSILLRISHHNLKSLIESSDNFEKFSLIIFENAISATSQRANDLATLSGEERYKKLLVNQPTLVQNVPVKYIASFLGVMPESLSRIRRQIII